MIYQDGGGEGELQRREMLLQKWICFMTVLPRTEQYKYNLITEAEKVQISKENMNVITWISSQDCSNKS